MPETAAARLESKVDTLLTAVGELKTAHVQLTDRMTADKRLNDQLIGFMQQAMDRMESEIATERAERRNEIATVRGTLSRMGWVLFTTFLTAIGAGAVTFLAAR